MHHAGYIQIVVRALCWRLPRQNKTWTYLQVQRSFPCHPTPPLCLNNSHKKCDEIKHVGTLSFLRRNKCIIIVKSSPVSLLHYKVSSVYVPTHLLPPRSMKTVSVNTKQSNVRVHTSSEIFFWELYCKRDKRWYCRYTFSLGSYNSGITNLKWQQAVML